MPETSKEKQTLRQQFRQIRQNLPEKAAVDVRLQERFCQLDAFRQCRTLLAYAATAEEAETRWILEQAWQMGKIVGLPRCLPGRQMVFCAVTGWEDLEAGAFGILAPAAHCPVIVPEAETVVLVPGVAFDRQGYRIGYGGGYYDRFLQKYPALLRIGYCAAACVTERLPREETDLPVHLLLTERTLEVG